MDKIASGQSKVISFDIGEGKIASSASWVLTDPFSNEELTSGSVADLSTNILEVSIDPSFNVVDESIDTDPLVGRVVTLTCDVSGETLEFKELYAIESKDFLMKGRNGFAGFNAYLITAELTPEIAYFKRASELDKKMALDFAFKQMSKMSLVGFEPYSKLEDIPVEDYEKFNDKLKLFMMAQIIQADDLLGGNPIEDQRQSGVLSKTIGESSHFFRTAKPVDYPICQRAMKLIKGYVTFRVRIGRA